ncbi:MAG: KGG domain-containing protein [Tepidisphaeraceae bacterium]
METRTRNRGFAAMDQQKQREIARKGGRAAHQKGTAHVFSRDEARQAGRKGGERVSANRAHMAEIGRLGGKSSAGRRRAAKDSGGINAPSSMEDAHQGDGSGQVEHAIHSNPEAR